MKIRQYAIKVKSCTCKKTLSITKYVNAQTLQGSNSQRGLGTGAKPRSPSFHPLESLVYSLMLGVCEKCYSQQRVCWIAW